ncbi:MAG: PDZ domain-containing protein [bacterium]|nr:PDZ domain-containing protein [bacterium]
MIPLAAFDQGEPITDSGQTQSAGLFSHRNLMSGIIGGLIVLAAFGLGRLSSSDPAETATTLAAAPATTTTSTTTTTTTAPPPTTTTTAPTTTTTVLDPVVLVTREAANAVVQIETSYGQGSGIVYDEYGHIVTAAHVVDSNDVVTVRLADGRELDGEVLGRHEDTDIAVIQVSDFSHLQTASLALNAELQIGQTAVALGSPFGFDQTVTAGIISSIDRVIDGIAMIQTDAAINPGNSGGPLLDTLGRVIGVNDVIFSYSGTNEGVGFAISIDVAAVVADQIIAGTDVYLAYLGVTVSDATGDIPGASVDRVASRSPASEAGLERGDVIVAVDGIPINRADMVRSRVIRKRPADSIDIDLMRDGDTMSFTVTLGETDG